MFRPSKDALKENDVEVPSYPSIVSDTLEYRVETGSSGAAVYLVKRSGRRFSEFGRTEADDQGAASLFVDPEIAESEDVYILYGTPQIKGQAPLPDSTDTPITFE